MLDWKNLQQMPASNSKKILKFSVSLGITLLVIWIFVLAQTGNDQYALKPQEQARMDSLHAAVTQNAGSLQREESVSLFSHALPVFFVLIIILGGIWFWGRKNAGRRGPTLFKVLGSQPLGNGQELKVIQINHEIWVIGITGQEITLLRSYAADDWDANIDMDTKVNSDLGSIRADQSFMSVFKEKLES